MHTHTYKCERISKLTDPHTHEHKRVAMFFCTHQGCYAYMERPALDRREAMNILEDYNAR